MHEYQMWCFLNNDNEISIHHSSRTKNALKYHEYFAPFNVNVVFTNESRVHDLVEYVSYSFN